MDRDIAHLKQLLETEYVTLARLATLLEEERHALASRDVEGLESITARKVAVLDEVETCDAARAAWAGRHGLDDAHTTFDRFIADSLLRENGDRALAEAWDRLRDMTRTVHRENLVNGRIIARSRQTLSQLLHLLRGQTEAPQLYGRGGKASTSTDGGEIARA